jgi:hypothetical protein
MYHSVSEPGGKARKGRNADHLSPFSAEVKNEKELYHLSPLAPVWSTGTALLFNTLYMDKIFTWYLKARFIKSLVFWHYGTYGHDELYCLMKDVKSRTRTLLTISDAHLHANRSNTNLS